MFGPLLKSLALIWSSLHAAANQQEKRRRPPRPKAPAEAEKVRANFYLRAMRLARELRQEREHGQRLEKLDRRQSRRAMVRPIAMPSGYLDLTRVGLAEGPAEALGHA